MAEDAAGLSQLISLVGLVGLVVFVVASLLVGSRILLLAIRSREFAETTVGLSLVLAGAVGTALSIVPSLAPDGSAQFNYLCNFTSLIASHLGFALLFLFVWKVFRPRDRWAAVLFAACMVALTVGGVGSALSLKVGDELVGPRAEGHVWFWISLGSRLVGYAWATFESFHYYAMLRRRVAVGLADANMVARFFYWGVCTTAVELIWITAAAQKLASSESMIQSWVSLVSALLGFVVAGSLWQAFFPSAGAPESRSATTQGQSVSVENSS